MMRDLKQVDLKQVRDEVADRVGRAVRALSSGAGNAARELGASAVSQARQPRGATTSAVIAPSGRARGRADRRAD